MGGSSALYRVAEIVLVLGTISQAQWLALEPSGRHLGEALSRSASCSRCSGNSDATISRVVDLGLFENGVDLQSPQGNGGAANEIFDMAIGVPGVAVGAVALRSPARQLCNPGILSAPPQLQSPLSHLGSTIFASPRIWNRKCFLAPCKKSTCEHLGAFRCLPWWRSTLMQRAPASRMVSLHFLASGCSTGMTCCFGKCHIMAAGKPTPSFGCECRFTCPLSSTGGARAPRVDKRRFPSSRARQAQVMDSSMAP